MPREQTLSAASGAIMLVGLVVLIVTGGLWPWMLAVMGLAVLPRAVQRGGLLAGGLAAGMLIGLAALIATGTLWPGVLVLIVIAVVARAMVQTQGARR